MIEVVLAAVMLVVVYELAQIAAFAARELSRADDRADDRAASRVDDRHAHRVAGGGGRSRPQTRRCPARTLASDAERDRTARAIGEAMAQGRLGLDEGIRRIEAALVARHTGDLDTLASDLPQPPGSPFADRLETGR
ncbi:MAG: DUF1707 domain-containing protein [Actinomycetota bacterium]|jgi:hypothetical protein|nr:DUF1707 domain-containing protein [Actinomycetota bacterium]